MALLTLTDSEAGVLNAIQWKFPLAAAPFAAMLKITAALFARCWQAAARVRVIASAD